MMCMYLREQMGKQVSLCGYAACERVVLHCAATRMLYCRPKFTHLSMCARFESA